MRFVHMLALTFVSALVSLLPAQVLAQAQVAQPPNCTTDWVTNGTFATLEGALRPGVTFNNDVRSRSTDFNGDGLPDLMMALQRSWPSEDNPEVMDGCTMLAVAHRSTAGWTIELPYPAANALQPMVMTGMVYGSTNLEWLPPIRMGSHILAGYTMATFGTNVSRNNTTMAHRRYVLFLDPSPGMWNPAVIESVQAVAGSDTWAFSVVGDRSLIVQQGDGRSAHYRMLQLDNTNRLVWSGSWTLTRPVPRAVATR